MWSDKKACSLLEEIPCYLLNQGEYGMCLDYVLGKNSCTNYGSNIFYVSCFVFIVPRQGMAYKKHSRNWFTRYYKYQDYTPQTHLSLVKASASQTAVAILKLGKVVGVH